MGEAPKKQRRGIRFPTYSLEKALDVARVVYEKGAGRLTKESIATALGHSITSSALASKIAAAKHFGLLEEEDNFLKVTDLARQILIPTKPEERSEGLKQAFLTFPVFKQIYERFLGLKLPERSTFENILQREYGASVATKGDMYEVLVNSGKFAGVILETEEGLLCGTETEERIKELEAADKTIRVSINNKLVNLCEKIGSLKLISSLYPASEDVKLRKEMETFAHNLLTESINLASELNLPATKMATKITLDLLKKEGLNKATLNFSYIREGLNEDLKLEEAKEHGGQNEYKQ